MSTVSSTQGHSVTAGGLHLHVEEAGDGDPIVIVHHSIGPLWAPFHDQLARTMRVVQPDLPGYGRSERPVEARSPRDLAVLCLRGLDELGLDRTAIVGFGLGGWIAADMVAMNPRRFSAQVLVGAAGIKPREGFIHDPMMSGWIDYVQLGFSSPAAFAEMFGEKPSTEIVDLWDRSREMTARITWRPWMWNTSFPLALRGLATPTLLVWGAGDRIVPLDCAKQYADLLPDTRLEVVEGAGHNVELEQPEALVELITDFLASKGR